MEILSIEGLFQKDEQLVCCQKIKYGANLTNVYTILLCASCICENLFVNLETHPDIFSWGFVALMIQ